MQIKVSDLIIPLFAAIVVVYGLIKGENIFQLFMAGVREGFSTVYGIAPAMFAVILALEVFKASGALDLIKAAADPVLSTAGLPSEVVPLMILRPISGSGALAVFKDIISSEGPDSFAGRVASVMQGSTETTFYTMALYYGVTRVKNTRHTLVAAAAGDMAGFIMSAVTVIFFLGRQ